MAGFAFALALDANEIQVEKHIELCCSLSRTRKSHLTTIKTIHVAGLISTFNYPLHVANEIQDEIHIKLCYSPSRYRGYHLTTIKAVMAGFAFALALDTNEIHVERHIELCYSLSRYRESHLTTIKAIHFHLGMQLLKFCCRTLYISSYL